jgi:phage terminase large subunit GpA-like protein
MNLKLLTKAQNGSKKHWRIKLNTSDLLALLEKSKAEQDVYFAYQALRPPLNLSVAEGAAKSLVIVQPGASRKNWDASETPYMVEPMNALASRKHEAVCFVGPARTGKTMSMIDGWMTHNICYNPGDMLIVQMTKEKAREFSKTRVDRALRYSDELRNLRSPSPQHDNTHDKMFKNGMWLKIGWPTITNFSSTDYMSVALTDYDRMPDDIDGEGAGFSLAKKRTQTFGSRGMTAVESSPGRDIADPNWKAATAHEGPPVTGIVGIYNLSDRHRMYWPCPDCGEYFMLDAGLGLFNLPKEDDLLEVVRTENLHGLAKQYSRVVCPHCGSLIDPKQKHQLNLKTQWLADGERITKDGERYGTPLSSTIAGYWMGTAAAAYQSWQSIIHLYLQGLKQYEMTGSEDALATTVNVDQGAAYLPRHLKESAGNAATETEKSGLERYIVPRQARFLLASVDVQGGTNARFEVQIFAVGIGNEMWVVDRFFIKKSKRPGVDEDGFAPLDPASYPEDWDVLTDKVVNSTYKCEKIEGDQQEYELRVLLTHVDTGGEAGVTEKAYAWYRRLDLAGLSHRVMLSKGASSPTAPRLRLSYVGKDKNTSSQKIKGDIPLHIFNPNLAKDVIFAWLRRKNQGPGFVHLPKWANDAFFDELYRSEVRNQNGTYTQIKPRNETLDLFVLAWISCLRLGVHDIKDWNRAPPWALPVPENRETMIREQRLEMKADAPMIAKASAPAPRVMKVKSRYLS